MNLEKLIKEKKILLKMSSAMGQKDSALAEEIDSLERKFEQEKELRIKEAKLLEQLNEAINQIVDGVPQLKEELKAKVPQINTAPIVEVVEKIENFPKKEQSTIDKVIKAIDKLEVAEGFRGPNPKAVDKDMGEIQKRIKYLETWLGKITMSGPGSGEVNFRWLDDVARETIEETLVLQYDTFTQKFYFGRLKGDHGPVDSIQFNLMGSANIPGPGTIDWDSNEDCLQVLGGDGSLTHVGLDNFIEIYNSSNATISKGSALAFGNVFGDEQLVPTYHIANGSIPPLYTIGIAVNDVAPNVYSRAITLGKVRNLNTTGNTVGESWQRGDLLWVHPSLPGKLTKVQPTAPNVAISMAAVLKSDASNGIILVRPSIFPRLHYASYYSTADQLAANVDYPYAATYSNVTIQSGFRLDASNTRIIADYSGLYNFSFSLQVTSGVSASRDVYIWARKNNVDIPFSSTKVTIASNSVTIAPAWSYVVSLKAGEWFQLMWAANGTTVELSSLPATAFSPTTPSVLISVNQLDL